MKSTICDKIEWKLILLLFPLKYTIFIAEHIYCPGIKLVLLQVPAEMVDHCFNHDFKEGMLTMEQLLDMDTTNPY